VIKRALILGLALTLSAPGAMAQEDAAPAAPATQDEAAPETPAAQDEAASAAPAPMAAPPPSRERPPENTDEGGLWGLSDRAEQSARASGQLERDAALNAYLHGVACRVAGPYCGDVRLYVMNRPFFNASMAPNGYMEVWSGLLLRAEDEAQLAFVLGHETGHYSERHSIETLRTIRGRATAALILSVGASAAGAGYAGDLIYLGALASVFGFSRENESEADMLGFDHAVAAGYAASAGAALWANLIAETRASDNPDVRRRETRASIFATHPLSSERVEALEERASEHDGAGGETHRERYRAAIRPFLDPWLRAELRRRDFGQTLLVLERLAAHGEDLGMVEYYRGEAHRIRRGEGDAERAQAHYVGAIVHPDAPAAAWRELGDIALRAGRNAEAAQHFNAYLERAPEAEDRALVEARLAQLTAGETQ
jgi:predicted Zn-dependent protease